MYAVVVSGGKQYRINEGDTVKVDRLQAEEGGTVELSDVLLVGGGKKIKVGTPNVKGAKVTAEVVSHDKERKVETYRYRRTRRTRKSRGFRAQTTTLKITSIKG